MLADLQQQQADATCQAIIDRFKPDIVRVLWDRGYDHDDEQCVFVKVVMTDDAARRYMAASRKGTHFELPANVAFAINEDLREYGLVYTNFRSESEAAKTKDPGWN